jgi:acetyl-CoA acetyltransferase
VAGVAHRERRQVKDRTAIVGIGETEFAKRLAPSETELACIAIRNALDDAGIDPSEVDALASFTMETTDEIEISRNVGFGDISFFSQVGYGGGGGCATVGHLAAAIASGQANVGVAWRSRKRGTGQRPWATVGERLHDSFKYSRPYGLLRPADEISMLMRRYMHEYGATRDHLANIAIACRSMANENPNAIMRDRPLTRDEYMNARWISEPLCLYDNCLESDGALACVVVPAERATDCPNRPVYIHAASQGISREQNSMANFYCDDPLDGPGWAAARALWSRSDLTPKDVPVAQIYDAFTPLILLSLEAYGFCPRGEAPAFTEDGGLERGGRLPINTSGGGLSEAYVHGFNLINEGVRQMRGSSVNQVGDAEACLVTSGECVPTSALLLRR